MLCKKKSIFKLSILTLLNRAWVKSSCMTVRLKDSLRVSKRTGNKNLKRSIKNFKELSLNASNLSRLCLLKKSRSSRNHQKNIKNLMKIGCEDLVLQLTGMMIKD